MERLVRVGTSGTVYVDDLAWRRLSPDEKRLVREELARRYPDRTIRHFRPDPSKTRRG